MNANKQDAGGLLPCPFCATEECGVIDTSHGVWGACGKCGTCGPFTTCKEDALAAWNRRELCRAAPAGGDAAVCGNCDGSGEVQTGECVNEDDYGKRTCPECDGTGRDSAPAGSGEVEEMAQRLEERAKWFRDGNDDATLLRAAAALLRKLQQGAGAPKESQ